MSPAAPLGALGRIVLETLARIGRVTIFALDGLSHILRPPFYAREFGLALFGIGWASLPVVGLTAAFSGGALVLQIYAGGARFNAEAVVPQIVAIGIVRELGPVLVGLMVAARVTSSIAAEIATMKVTEQIDALITLSTDPMKYLVAPRLLAALVTVPMLVAIGDLIGIAGGYGVAVWQLGFAPVAYLQTTIDFLEYNDIASSLAKGVAFGGIAAIIGCYFGLRAGNGAQGVGRATKASVETAAMLILAANFLLTGLFFVP
ncbi:MlaE family ABC transporter permease [Lutimaribacter marinistellae]|uniref:MlaE family ABC transporter permease n=1 Tax=Lutimaribacter marinistellae TaxID=1820329 RepID=A0ABV7TJQ3_9RHOB